MSAQPERRSPQIVAFREDRLTPRQAVLVAAKASGCTCDPDVAVDDARATVRHDPWCALLRREDRN